MNFIYKCANREQELINLETNLLTELEGSICTGEFIYPYSDIDIRVYSKEPRKSAYNWKKKNGLHQDPVKLTSANDGSIYVFSYSKKFCFNMKIKFEVSFTPLSVREKFKENEKNRIDNIDKTKWMNDKLKWYRIIEMENDAKKKENLRQNFMIWKKTQIAKYKIHQIYYR